MYVNSGSDNYPDWLSDENYDYIHGSDDTRSKRERYEDELADFECDVMNGK